MLFFFPHTSLPWYLVGWCVLVVGKDENIGNHGYIGTSILRIYRRYIGGYFGKKYR